METQDAHPENVYKSIKGFFDHMESEQFDLTTVSFSIRKALGHHRYAHVALKGEPNILETKVYEIGKWLEGLKTKLKLFSVSIALLKGIKLTCHPSLLFLDYIKAVVLYRLLNGTVQRLYEGCTNSSFGCLAVSAAEENLLLALLVSLSVSIITTTLLSLQYRNQCF